MKPRTRRRLQRLVVRTERAYRDLAEIRAGDHLASRFASFGKGSIIEAPQLAIINPASVAIGTNTHIRQHVCIEALAPPGTVVLRIGDGNHIGYFVRFIALNGIEIGDDIGIGHGTTITDTIHDYKTNDTEPGRWQGSMVLGRPLRVESGSWIGNNNVITGGITIGAGAITTPNSVINRNVPPNTIVGGNPARVLRRKGPTGEWEWLIDPATLDLETQAMIEPNG